MQKTKAHQRYKTSKGEPCVGVTTVLGVIAKPQLVNWANRLGLDGYDVTKWVDALANIGTLTHYLVECDCRGVEPELGDYSQNDIATARFAFQKWISWKRQNTFQLIDSELQIVSDKLKVGGTCDIYAKVNGKLTLLDIKTSKGIYSEMRTQCVAYKYLLTENGKQVDECRIVRIGRNEGEGFEDCLIGNHPLHWQRFLACLSLYHCNKTIENGGA